MPVRMPLLQNVIDVSQSPWKREDIEKEAQRQLALRDDFTEVLLIADGYMKRYRK